MYQFDVKTKYKCVKAKSNCKDINDTNNIPVINCIINMHNKTSAIPWYNFIVPTPYLYTSSLNPNKYYKLKIKVRRVSQTTSIKCQYKIAKSIVASKSELNISIKAIEHNRIVPNII